MFLVISEIHIPTHTQNAIFLTALQHFSSYVTFTDSTESLNTTSVLHPKPQALSQPRKCCVSDGCGTAKEGECRQSTCSWAWMVAPCGDIWLSFPPPHCMLWYRRVLYTILVMVSHGSWWAWGRHTNPYTECALIPLAHLSAAFTGSWLGGWSPLLSPWTRFLRWQHLTHLLPLDYMSQWWSLKYLDSLLLDFLNLGAHSICNPAKTGKLIVTRTTFHLGG